MKAAGIIIIIIGVLTLAFPYFTAVSIEMSLGLIMLLTGGSHLGHVWRGQFDGRAYHLGLALLFFAAGSAMLAFPHLGVLSFTVVLGASFVLQGILQSLYALQFGAGRAKMMFLISGVVGIVAGALILASLPSSAAWAVGILVGVNLIFLGIALLSMRIDVAVIDVKS